MKQALQHSARGARFTVGISGSCLSLVFAFLSVDLCSHVAYFDYSYNAYRIVHQFE